MSKKTLGTPDDDSTPTKEDTKAQPSPKDTPTKAKSDTRTLMPSKMEEDEDSVAYMNKNYYPPGWTSSEKMSKETAEYKKGQPFHRCGLCTYYQSSHCKIVRGYISPDMGCNYFQEKYDPSRFKISLRVGRDR